MQSGESSQIEQSRAALPAAQNPPATTPARSRAAIAPQSGAQSGAEPLVIARFEDLLALAAEKRDLGVKLALERDVRLVRCENGRLELRLEQSAAKTLVNDLARKISQWTNRPWIVVVSAEAGQPTLKSQNDAHKAELKTGVRADPLVQAVLARFPGAEIVDVRKGGADVCDPLVPADGGGGNPEPLSDESDKSLQFSRAAQER
jgi:DNA polymerase-3 subunit gamma/tau